MIDMGEVLVDFYSVVFIAFGLAMDAFAVSAAIGILVHERLFYTAIRIGLFFGGFQAIMPIIGWFAGMKLNKYIADYDHWIAFALLSIIGIKMIYDAVIDEEKNEINPYDYIVILFLAVATSIDALAVGVSFAFLETSIYSSAIIIGIITFSLSLFGVVMGKKLGEIFKSKMEIAGGLVLLAIGLKIVLTA